MKFSLLTNALNDLASPWNAVAVMRHVAARSKRAKVHLIVGKPFGRSVPDEVVGPACDSPVFARCLGSGNALFVVPGRG